MRAGNDLKAKWVKLLAATLALSAILAGTEAMGRERRGATVIVTLKQWSQASGELIAVKPASILLLESSGRDLSIELAELRSVRVLKKSKAGAGAFFGLVVGAAGGYFGGYASAVASGACPDCEAPLSGYMFGIISGLIGLGVGGMIGDAAGRDVVIPIGGQTGPELAVQVRKLRQYARVSLPL